MCVAEGTLDVVYELKGSLVYVVLAMEMISENHHAVTNLNLIPSTGNKC